MILMKSLDEVSKVPWALELLLYKTQNVKRADFQRAFGPRVL